LVVIYPQIMSKQVFFLTLFLLLIVFTVDAKKKKKEFFWESVNVDVNILKNGDIQVKERQILHFIDEFTFGYRTIPTHVHGKNDGIENLQVKEFTKSGIIEYKPLKSENGYYYVASDSWSSEFKIYWYFPKTTGSHEYEFSYTVKRAIRKHEGNLNELYWQLIPADHQRMIKRFSSKITFEDSNVSTKSTEVFINGDQNLFKHRNGKIQQNPMQISCDLLYTRDYLEIKLIYDSEFEIQSPRWMERETTSRFLDSLVFVFGFIYLLIPLILVFYIYKEPNVDKHMISMEGEEENLPSELPPALASSLINNYGTPKDIIATLINLCRKGYLKIEDTGSDWIFQKVKSLSELDEHEMQVVACAFQTANSVTLSSLNQKFYVHMGTIYSDIYKELKIRSLTHSNPKVLAFRFCLLGVLFPFSSIILQIFQFSLGLNISMGFTHFLAVIGLVMMLYFAYNYSFSVKTVSGTIEARKWKNFKGFLTKVSKGEKTVDPAIFESYLPFAVAFGVTGYTAYWNQIFGQPGLERHQPMWYVHTGTRSRDDYSFEDRFDQMCRRSETTFTSSPPSKSSSSSSRGGGSGGGGSMGFG
jgi:uncharacterized membrane protein